MSITSCQMHLLSSESWLSSCFLSKRHSEQILWITNWVLRVSIPWWAINRLYWVKNSTSGNKAPPADWLTCVACSFVAFMHMYQSLPVGESCPCSFSSWAAWSPQTPPTRVFLILKLSLKASKISWRRPWDPAVIICGLVSLCFHPSHELNASWLQHVSAGPAH